MARSSRNRVGSFLSDGFKERLLEMHLRHYGDYKKELKQSLNGYSLKRTVLEQERRKEYLNNILRAIDKSLSKCSEMAIQVVMFYYWEQRPGFFLRSELGMSNEDIEQARKEIITHLANELGYLPEFTEHLV